VTGILTQGKKHADAAELADGRDDDLALKNAQATFQSALAPDT
jgi:hypothetical protein